MRIEQAIVQSQIEINRKMNSAMAIGYINNIQMRLAINFETARIKETVTIESNDSSIYHNLSDYVDNPLKVENVKYTEGLTRYRDYEVEDKQIRFADSGSFQVKVQRMPDLNSLKTDEMKLPTEYHFTMSKWLSFKELAKLYGAKGENPKRLEEEFWVMVNEVDSNLKRLNKKPRKIKAPRW